LITTEWAGKKVVLFSVPGAFTPGCSAKHLPGYIENLSKLKAKGVDIVATIAFNDAWVMSAWGKANGIKDDSIVRIPFHIHPNLHYSTDTIVAAGLLCVLNSSSSQTLAPNFRKR
jgi:peroxiredoxin